MFNISNSLTLLRAPLALLFLQESPFWRCLAILLAMITDSVDGYLARKSKTSSKFGAILDPLMDKFFVYFALFIFAAEGRLNAPQIAAILSRDIALLIYGLTFLISGKWRALELRGIRWGKIATSLQFLILIGLSLNFQFPTPIYYCFAVLGLFSLIELFTPVYKT